MNKPKNTTGPAPRDPLAQVTEWILSGESEHDVIAAIAAKWPDENAPALIAAVVADMERTARASAALLGWCVAATRDLHRRALEAGDLPTALRSIKQLAALVTAATKKAKDDDNSSHGLSLADLG